MSRFLLKGKNIFHNKLIILVQTAQSTKVSVELIICLRFQNFEQEENKDLSLLLLGEV